MVDDDFDQPAGRHRALDVIEEADELLVPVLLDAAMSTRCWAAVVASCNAMAMWDVSAARA
jgi:hypothetical protein